MPPLLLFADRLPPLIGGMEMHARYFIEHFQDHPRWPLCGVVTRDEAGRDCLLQGERRAPVALAELPRALPLSPSVVFFNSGRWIEDLPAIRAAFPDARFVYRTGGNEILKAPLERARIDDHRERQRFWVERLAGCLDALITNSAFTEERLAALGLPRPLFVRCVGGVNVEALQAAAQLGREPGVRPVLFCGARFVPYKNHALLLEVLAELAGRGLPFQIRLAGDGPLQAAAEAQAERLGLADRVAFLGALSNEEACAEIAQADIYLQLSTDQVTEVPGGSYVHAEGMGRAILEALSCGTFVIAARSGALPEVVTPARGMLVDLEPARAVADRLEPVVRAPPPRTPFFEGYSWQRVFARYEVLWEGWHARAHRD